MYAVPLVTMVISQLAVFSLSETFSDRFMSRLSESDWRVTKEFCDLPLLLVRMAPARSCQTHLTENRSAVIMYVRFINSVRMETR